MGIYGMGKAFNLRYANSGQFRPQHVRFRQPSRPMMGNVSYTENTNVTIKNGPSGFWGFLGGFFGGLFGGGGMGMGMNMGMGMPMGGMSPFGMLNTQMAQPQIKTAGQTASNQLQNLKTLYPKFNIVADEGAKFSATDADGHLIGKQLSYEDMLSALAKAKETQGSGDGAGDGKVKKDDGAGDGAGDGKVKKDDGSGDGAGDGKVKKDDGSGKLKASDLKGYTGMMGVHDDVRGAQYDINGNATVSKETDESSGYPKTITVKGHRYEYQRTDNGTPIYKSLDGAGDEYRLEKDANGKFGLNQYKGDKGAGTADISTKRTTPAKNAAPPSAENNEPKSTKVTIDASQIKKGFDNSYSYTYIKVPHPPVTVSITHWETQGLTQAQIQEKLQAKLDEALGQ